MNKIDRHIHSKLDEIQNEGDIDHLLKLADRLEAVGGVRDSLLHVLYYFIASAYHNRGYLFKMGYPYEKANIYYARATEKWNNE